VKGAASYRIYISPQPNARYSSCSNVYLRSPLFHTTQYISTGKPQRIATMSPVATKQSHPTGSTKKLSSEQVIHLEHEHSAHNYHPLPV
jgi:hypothetical protein